MRQSNLFYQSDVNRFEIIFRRLTVVRLFFWLFRIIKKGFIIIGQTLFKVLRFFGLLCIEVGYGIKLKLVDWRYRQKKDRLKFQSVLVFLVSIILIIPRSFLTFLQRLSNLSIDTASRAQQGLVKETQDTFKPVSKKDAQWSFKWSVVNFVLTLVVITLPIVGLAQWRKLANVKFSVLSSGAKAFTNLFSAKSFLESNDLPQAKNAFTEASGNFLQAQEDLSDIHAFLFEIAAVFPSKSIRAASSGRHLIEAGKLSSEIGGQLSQAMVLPEGQEHTVSNFLENFIVYSEPTVALSKKLEEEISMVDATSLPVEYQQQFQELSDKIGFLSVSIQEAVSLAHEATIFLGEKVDKRYMLVFQNNTEKRGPGGFIGSFALVDIRRGEITQLQVPKGGTYDTEAGLNRLVAAPEPLRLLNPRWHFWDANWWPDWSTSAKKLMWFYENSNGPSVDGVITLTPTVIERALEVIGPIDMTADYGVVIDSQNFWTVTQTFSEQKPDVTKEPKKIIGDLINKIMEELPKRLTTEKTIALISLMERNLNEKQVMAYFNDPILQASTERFGWSGKIQNTDKDYLMVVNTNIGGQKTDRVIDENLFHTSKILPDGSIIDTLTIERKHLATRGEEFIGVRNVDWMRIYTPEGSQLISATGFKSPDQSLFESPDPKSEQDPDLQNEREAITDIISGTKIYTEKNKTVFANWSMVDPGETTVITLQYKLPFQIRVESPPVSNWKSFLKKFIEIETSNQYSLLVQKQPGALSTNIQSILTLDNSINVYWGRPQESITQNGWNFNTPLNTDIYTAILFK
jgi:hypothetical protein